MTNRNKPQQDLTTLADYQHRVKTMTHLKKLIEEAYHYSLESVPDHFLFGGNASIIAIESYLAGSIGQLELMTNDLDKRIRLEQKEQQKEQ